MSGVKHEPLMLEPILDLAVVSPQGYRLMVHFSRHTHTLPILLSQQTRQQKTLNVKRWMESERNADESAVKEQTDEI